MQGLIRDCCGRASHSLLPLKQRYDRPLLSGRAQRLDKSHGPEVLPFLHAIPMAYRIRRRFLLESPILKEKISRNPYWHTLCMVSHKLFANEIAAQLPKSVNFFSHCFQEFHWSHSFQLVFIRIKAQNSHRKKFLKNLKKNCYRFPYGLQGCPRV